MDTKMELLNSLGRRPRGIETQYGWAMGGREATILPGSRLYRLWEGETLVTTGSLPQALRWLHRAELHEVRRDGAVVFGPSAKDTCQRIASLMHQRTGADYVLTTTLDAEHDPEKWVWVVEGQRFDDPVDADQMAVRLGVAVRQVRA